MNPYQPPTAVDPSTTDLTCPDRIEIHGHVEAEDLRKLIGTPWLFRVFQVVCFVALALFSMAPIAAVSMPNRKWTAVLLLVGVVLVLAAFLYAVAWYLSPRGRSRRMLKRNPGIIGPIDGWLDAFGLTSHSDANNEFHQLSWATFKDVAVTRDGIRLAWNAPEPFTIAIPSSCIDGYSSILIKEWVHTFRSNATEPAIGRMLMNRDAMPRDGIWFECVIPAKPPLTVAEHRRIKIYTAIQTIAYLAFFGLYLAGGLNTFWFFTLLVAPMFITIAARVDYARAAPAAYQYGMWGWITADEIVGHLPGQIWNARWVEATKFDLTIDHLHAEFADGSGVRLTRSDIGGAWTEVTEMLSGVAIR